MMSSLQKSKRNEIKDIEVNKSNFSNCRVRLAQLTNKCDNNDLEYYVKESGDILGVTDKVKNRHDAKAILRHVLEELVNFFNFYLLTRVYACRFASKSSIIERAR